MSLRIWSTTPALVILVFTVFGPQTASAHFHGIRAAMVRPGNSLSTVFLEGRTHGGGVIEISFGPSKGGKFGSRSKGLHDASNLALCENPADPTTCPLLDNTGNILEVEADVTDGQTGAVTHRVFSFVADCVRGSLRLSGNFNLNPADTLAVREIRLKDPQGYVFAYTGMIIAK